MSEPTITKNLFKLKKVMLKKKDAETVGSTGLDVEALLGQINLQPEPQGPQGLGQQQQPQLPI